MGGYCLGAFTVVNFKMLDYWWSWELNDGYIFNAVIGGASLEILVIN